MKKIIFIFLPALMFLYSLILASPVFAKKKIGSSKGSSKISSGIIISPKLRKDRKALLVTFSNLQNVSSFTYELTYLANGIDQGVYGSVTPKGEGSTSRDLLFATCSHNVCRYHTNIQNMRFVVKSSLKNGQKISKSYRVKP